MKMNKKQTEELTKKLKSKEFDGHRWPTSRRDFLKLGVAELAAFSLMPTLNIASQLDVKSKPSAQRNLASLPASMIPLLVFDLQGGGALSGNFVVGKEIKDKNNIQLLPSYSTLGWNSSKDSIDARFGLPLVSRSQILQGMLSTWNADQQKYFESRLRFVGICNSSLDDTSNNPLSIAAAAFALGNRGKYIAEFTGTKSSASGGNSAAMQGDQYKAIYVANSRTLSSLLSLNVEKIVSDNSELEGLKKFLFKNSLRLRDMKDKSEEFSNAFSAFGSENQTMNSINNQQVASLYQLRQGAENDRSAIVSSVVMNSILGNTGPGVIEFGGYDYHDGSQQTGDTKDRELGIELGRAFLLASILNKPLFIQMITDGGVSSAEGARAWAADSKDRSMTVLAMFHPEAAFETSQLQIGSYTNGQIVNANTYVGASVENATMIALMNYLSLSGVSPEKVSFFNQNSLGNASLDEMIVFKKKV